MGRKSYRFGHELALDEKGFLLGVDFPFRKEKFLKFDFRGEAVEIGGSLYGQLSENLNENVQLRKELKTLLSSWARLLASVSICRNDSRGKDCFFHHLDQRWALKAYAKEGRLTFSYRSRQKNGRKIIFDNFEIGKGYFNRQKIDIHFSGGRIVMEFFTNSCSRQ